MIRYVQLDINGTEFICEVDYDFTCGFTAKVHGPPENCYPGEADVWTINALTIHKGICDTSTYSIDILIGAFQDDLVCLLEAQIEEEQDYHKEPDDL